MFDRLNAVIEPGLNFVVGRNGVGKTTLFGLVRGQLSGSGSIAINDGADAQCAIESIGYLPQTFSVPAGLTAREFVEYIAWVRGMPRRKLAEAAAIALERVALADRADDRLASLSGGMIRRVGVAQAIIDGSSLLLLDEPTVGLDPIQRSHLRRTLRELAASMTVVVSTHLLDDIGDDSEHLLILNTHRAIFNGTVADLRAKLGGADAVELSMEAMFLRLHGEVTP